MTQDSGRNPLWRECVLEKRVFARLASLTLFLSSPSIAWQRKHQPSSHESFPTCQCLSHKNAFEWIIAFSCCSEYILECQPKVWHPRLPVVRQESWVRDSSRVFTEYSSRYYCSLGMSLELLLYLSRWSFSWRLPFNCCKVFTNCEDLRQFTQNASMLSFAWNKVCKQILW